MGGIGWLTLVPEHGHVAGVGGEADEVEDETVDDPVWQGVPERMSQRERVRRKHTGKRVSCWERGPGEGRQERGDRGEG